MSDPMAVLGAAARFGLTIAGKLDDAEYASEYNNGVEALRRGLTDFDASLQNDPDWRKYPERSAKTEQTLWNQVDQQTKNPRAKNDLTAAWQQMRDSHYSTILDTSNAVRIKTYHADLVKRMDGREKDVEAGRLTAAEAEAANAADLKQASDTGVIDPTTGFTTGEQAAGYAQYAEASRTIKTIAQTGGMDAALEALPNIMKQYNRLTATDSDNIISEVTKIDTIQRAAAKRQAIDNNNKIEDTIQESLKKNDFVGAKKALDSGKFLDIEGGLSAADNWWTWDQRIATAAKDDLTPRKSDDQSNIDLTAKSYAVDRDDPAQVEAFNKVIDWATGVRGSQEVQGVAFGSINVTDGDRMRNTSRYQTPTDKTDTAYAAFIKDIQTKHPDAKEQVPILNALAMFKKNYMAANSGAVPSTAEYMGELDAIEKSETDRAIYEAIFNIYPKESGQPIQGKASTPDLQRSLRAGTAKITAVPEAPAAVPAKPAPKAVPAVAPANKADSDFLTQKGITSVTPVTSNDGKVYYKHASGVIYWKDPKTGKWWLKGAQDKWVMLNW